LIPEKAASPHYLFWPFGAATVLLGEPRPTQYDIHFNLFGFPVRIHPAFFLLPVFLTLGVGDLALTLIFLAIFFVSILVHEMGHSLVMAYFGVPSKIVLYMMGGLAIPDTNPWQVSSRSSFSPGQQIMVSFAGPFAGFLLAAVLCIVTVAVGGSIQVSTHGIIPIIMPDFLNSSIVDNRYLMNLLFYSILINVYLNLINLLPVYPLDGGQIARELFVMGDQWNGIRNSLILSLVTGAAVALIMITGSELLFGLMFAMLAYNSWLSLQSYGSGGFGGGRW
jgi:stage IV sporulation protein FB